jgi:hypothetical protein
MGQVSKYLRRGVQGYFHYCPACHEMHCCFDSWNFDGNVESPTFSPSFSITGVKRKMTDDVWNGEWERDEHGKAKPMVCHYILRKGVLEFQRDCTHELAGKNIPLPELPLWAQDNVPESNIIDDCIKGH